MASNQSSSSSSPSNNSSNNSTTRRSPLVLYAFAFITVSLSSGLVYGYPHLRTNLLENGSTLSESQLGIVYTVGSWTVHGGRFFSGLARDSFGTRWVAFLSLLCAALGCIGLAFSNENHVASLSISLFLVGLGSGGQLCLQPVASLFDTRWQGTVLASLSGAFQISGLMFLVLQKITLDRRFSYAFFALILCALAILCVYLLPRNQFLSSHDHCDENEEGNQDEQKLKLNTSSNDDDDDNNNESSAHQLNDTVAIGKTSVYKNDKIRDAEMNETKSLQQKENETIQNNDNNNSNSNNNNNRQDQKKKDPKSSAMSLMKSKEYTNLIIWFSILLIPMQYYIGTIAFQLERKGDEDGRYLDIFSICYACAAIMAPIMGKMADLVGLGITQSLATILVASSLFILNHDNIAATAWTVQVIGFFFYCVGRMTVFGMFFTNIGKRFGYTHYGTLVGFGLLSTAIVSLLQYPLIYLADSQHEYIVNLISGIVILVACIPYCLWLARREMSTETS